MDSEYPDPETTLVMILGASEFPRAPQFTPAKAFLKSAIQVKSYFLDREGFNLSPENLLDLFDAPDPQPDLNEKIVNFLHTRLTAMKYQNLPARDLVVYYVGHGAFSPSGSEYYLAIRDTRANNEFFSSYPVKALAHTLKEHATFLRRYLILDSCFAAAASPVFMSPTLEAAFQKTAEEFPRRGTALLCASGPREPAKILPTLHYTMFTDALVHILRHGSSEGPEKLSLASLAQLTRAEIRERNLSEAVRPEVHSPDMREGDVAALPLFPNHAFRKRAIKEARVFVDILPQDATVRIPSLGVTFSQGMVLQPGRYQVEVSADGYESQSCGIDLEPGKDKRLKVELKKILPKKTRLFVKPVPETANVRILKIGVKFSQGMELYPGNYHVEVSARKYKTQTRLVRLNPGVAQYEEFRLKPSKSWWKLILGILSLVFLYYSFLYERTPPDGENNGPGITLHPPYIGSHPTDPRKAGIEQIVKSFYRNAYVVTLSDKQSGYFVVLGSFKRFDEAVHRVDTIRRVTGENIKLYYAENDYFAAGIGIYPTKDAAEAAKRRFLSVVPDAYSYEASVFPYEIRFGPN